MNSHRRKIEDNKRLHKLYLETKNHYGAGVYFDEEKNRYIRYYGVGRKCKKYFKKVNSKKVRNYKKDISSKTSTVKIYDLKWKLF